MNEVWARLRRASAVIFGIAAAVLTLAPIADAAISRFEPGGTAEATYGISPTDVLIGVRASRASPDRGTRFSR